jgi:hypothetical protein
LLLPKIKITATTILIIAVAVVFGLLFLQIKAKDRQLDKLQVVIDSLSQPVIVEGQPADTIIYHDTDTVSIKENVLSIDTTVVADTVFITKTLSSPPFDSRGSFLQDVGNCHVDVRTTYHYPANTFDWAVKARILKKPKPWKWAMVPSVGLAQGEYRFGLAVELTTPWDFGLFVMPVSDGIFAGVRFEL